MPDIAILLVIILIIVLVARGPKTLPQLGEALGRAVSGAKRNARGDDEEKTVGEDDQPAT